MKYLINVLIVVSCCSASALYAADKIGVLLMHGKGGTSLPESPVGKLAEYLEARGFLVYAPDMPWSRSRRFDKTYEDSMAEIDDKIRELSGKGATKIVVGGHSIGANAAIGYGARREGLAGILAIAPGHVPDIPKFQELTDHDYKRAKEMVASREGDKKKKFKDVNQGKTTKKKMKASVYASWFDPDGPAIIPKNAAALKDGTPLLWLIGKKDPMHKRGQAYAFEKAPLNIKSAYVVVKGGHKDAPQKGRSEIVKWLEGL